MDALFEMDEERCRSLLAAGGVGRVAVATPEGPHIVPVTYAVVDDAVVFRTSPFSLLATHVWQALVAFEIDHLDHERHRGWSVVARGRAEVVEDPREVQRIRETWDPRPWAGGQRTMWVRLRWTELTGRSVGAGWSHSDEPAVRRAV